MVDEEGFIVEGKRIERREIGEMWLEPENPVGPILSVALFGVIVIGTFALIMTWAFRQMDLPAD